MDLKPGKFRDFTIEVLSKLDSIQVEMAKVGDRQMVIATDLAYPISPDVYHQEAYGPDHIAPEAQQTIVQELRYRMLERRRTLQSGSTKPTIIHDLPTPPPLTDDDRATIAQHARIWQLAFSEKVAAIEYIGEQRGQLENARAEEAHLRLKVACLENIVVAAIAALDLLASHDPPWGDDHVRAGAVADRLRSRLQETVPEAVTKSV